MAKRGYSGLHLIEQPNPSPAPLRTRACGLARLAAQPDIILTSAFKATWVGSHSQSFIYPTPLIILCILNYLHIHAASCKYQQSGTCELEDWEREEVARGRAPLLLLSMLVINKRLKARPTEIFRRRGQVFFFMLTQRDVVRHTQQQACPFLKAIGIIIIIKKRSFNSS